MQGHVTDIERDTLDYRRVLYTGPNLQLVLMTLAPGEDIGRERHEGHDQLIRVEAGTGEVLLDGHTLPLKDGSSVVAAALGQWDAPGNPLRETMLGSICRPLIPGDGGRAKARIAKFLEENANR